MDRRKMANALNMLPNSSDEKLMEALSVIVDKANQLNPNSNWNLDDFLQKDPEALNKMAIENPQRFQALNDEYFSESKKDNKLSPAYQDATKKQLQKAKNDLMQLLTKEEREEFKESYPEEYAKIMNS